MTPKERGIQTRRRNLRIAVAKDVIKSLRKLKVRAGKYATVSFEGKAARKVINAKTSNEKAELLKRNCVACAIGSCFLSMVALDNKFELDKMADISEDFAEYNFNADADLMRERLGTAFTAKQLGLIETAFEMSVDFAINREASSEEADAAVAFGGKYTEDRARLRAIMRNIIANKGTFEPA